MAKLSAPSAELLIEALRAELAELKRKLASCERLRQDDRIYMRNLWDDNRRLHHELYHFNRRELKKVYNK
jgi:hypothetical protein